MRILSSVEKFHRMPVTYFSVISRGQDFCVICAPLMSYDGPDIVLCSITPICPTRVNRQRRWGAGLRSRLAKSEIPKHDLH